ncbi:MAG: CHAT domain-containing protein [Fimbriimonadales bacterium]|nr:CHAT domain-containing protein [Fimbriimonadales bacterium]
MPKIKGFGIVSTVVVVGLLGWSQTTNDTSAEARRSNSSPARQGATDLTEQLREIEQKIAQREYEEARQMTQRASRERTTLETQLYLRHLEARALHRMRPQTPAELDELIQLWELLRQQYRRAGNTPFEVETTFAMAFCYWQTNRPRAESLLSEAWARVESTKNQPLEVAQALSFSAEDWFEVKEWSIAQRLWERALALQEVNRAGALDLARTRYNLGVLALKQSQLDKAQALLQETLATQEQLAQSSPALAATLKAMGELAQRQNRLAEAKDLYQRALRIYDANGQNRLEAAQVHLGLGTLTLLQRRWDEAQAAYERALQIAQTTDPESREVGLARAGLGVVFLEKGLQGEAEKWLLQAKETPSLEPLEKAQIDYELGRVAQRSGKTEQAILFLTAALQQQNTLQDTPLNIAKTHYTLGVIYLESGDLNNAQSHLEASREIRQRELPESPATAHALMGLGFVAFYKSEFRQARALFNQARALYEASNAEPADRSRALMGLGIVAVELGELDEAQNYLQQATQLQKENQLENTILHAQTRIGLGNLMLRRSELDVAFVHYAEARRIAESLPTAQLLRAQALASLGNLYLRQRNLKQADLCYQQAYSLLERHAPVHPLKAQITLNRAVLALEAGETEQADYFLQQANALMAQFPRSDLTERIRLNQAVREIRSNNTPNTLQTLEQIIEFLQSPGRSRLLLAQAYFYRGVLHFRQNNLQAARSDLTQAFTLYQQIAPGTIFDALTQLGLAKLDYREGNIPSARERLENAIEIIERQRGYILDPDAQAEFSENYFEAYTLLALLETERGQYARAVTLLEQSRARTLTDQIQKRQDNFVNAPAGAQPILQRLRQIEAERIELRRQLEQAYLQEKDASEIQNRLTALYQQQLQEEKTLRERYPSYARLMTPVRLELTIIQQQLEPDIMLVYHALVENNLLILTVDKQGVQGYYFPVNAEQLRKDILDFRNAVYETEQDLTIRLGTALYQNLIGRVQPLRGARRVLLCPEGELNLLPWAALIVETRGEEPIYWIERVAIHLTPSMGVYRYARLSQPSSEGALVAAVSIYQAEQVQQSEPIQVAQSPGEQRRGGGILRNLPAAEKEANSLEQRLPNPTVLRNDQVEPHLVRTRASNARIVHLACHAEANAETPLDSVLKFDATGAKWVTAAEIMSQWQLQADLVMLSACETGAGKALRYEGVYGLARAFLYAGAKTVGATLWQVDDESTADIAVKFYEGYVGARLPKDRALQQAQREFLKLQRDAARRARTNQQPDRSLPYYWASFVIIGDCQ